MTKAQLSAVDMGDEAFYVESQFRGVLYRLTAVSMEEYEKAIDAATTKDEETKEETFDSNKNTRILLGKSLTKPEGLTVAQLYKKDPKLVRSVQKMLNELYWSDEPDELKALKKDAEKNGDDDEGSGSRDLTGRGELCFIFAEKFGLDPGAPGRWPFHKFMNVQYTFQIRELKDARARRKALAKARGEDDDTVLEWNQDSFERPDT